MKVTTCYRNLQICPMSHIKHTKWNRNITDDSSPSDDQVDGHKQTDPEKDNISSFWTVRSNITPVGHSTKLPDHTTTKILKLTKNKIVQNDYIT